MDIWEFALDFYARKGVSEACLLLQDEAGVDVTVLIHAAWCIAAEGRAVSREDIARADALVAPWRREIVVPLRTLRRRLRTGPAPAPTPDTEALRAQIKRTELEAERIALETLARATPEAAPARTSAAERLRAALDHLVAHYGPHSPSAALRAAADAIAGAAASGQRLSS